MDALAKATRALVEAKKELFEHDMTLEWDLKVGYIDSKWVKSVCPPPRPECTAQNGGSGK